MPGARFGRVRVWPRRFWVTGVLLPFSGNALFVGIRSPVTRPIDRSWGSTRFDERHCQRTYLEARMSEDYFCAGLHDLI